MQGPHYVVEVLQSRHSVDSFLLKTDLDTDFQDFYDVLERFIDIPGRNGWVINPDEQFIH